MSDSNEPRTRDEILAALDAVHREASELFSSFAPEDFFRRPEPEVWSAGENVVHLVKSVKAVADGMKMPKLTLRALFGTARQARSYSEMREVYLEALAQGAVASGRFVPQVSPAASEAELSQERALKGWQRAGDSLVKVVGKWSEAALDKYRLPHPVIGKLSVREMLFFTHYHDGHHLETVRKIQTTA